MHKARSLMFETAYATRSRLAESAVLLHAVLLRSMEVGMFLAAVVIGIALLIAVVEVLATASKKQTQHPPSVQARPSCDYLL